jgi:4a-hydroxytetrahydrobiopterin dehydratase
MSDVLDQPTLDARLASLEGWAGTPSDGIAKTYTRTDFADAVAFLNQVAEIADAANHHPDVAISWNKVTLTYVTHSAGGVTEADIDQAREVDERLA